VVVCQVDIPISVNITGPPQLVEDCGIAGFIISRIDTTTNLVVQIGLSGTATNGVDYPFIPNALTIPTGVFSDTITIEALLDSLTESTETVFFSVIVPNPCDGTFDTTSIVLNLVDYQPLSVIATDSINVCANGGEIPWLGCAVSFGLPPYQYIWSPGSFPNSDTVSLGGVLLLPNENLFSIEVQDQCGKTVGLNSILVYNQCPLEAPNVLTLNGDLTNDVFIIQHLADYNNVRLQVFNRWGNLVYENADYQNDWSGLTMDGKPLTDGVYFYTVLPDGEKYTYDDQDQTKFLLAGFLHIFH
jgi:gliding motility-associated-like protein